MHTHTDIGRPATLANKPAAGDVEGASVYVAAEEFREALSKIASTVSIVATDGPYGLAGFTCSAVCAVTDDPPTVMICVNRKSAANAVIKANGVLCVSSLGADQVELSQMFAGVGRVPMHDRFEGAHWGVLTTGSPYYTRSRVALDCRVADIREVGTHSLILGEVLSTAHSADEEPLIYHRRAYATVRNIA
ncbi:flavin reductase [Ensifer sp. ENS10]|uniref:flavin reductase family protein n=1 Tax=Ensifer sp. ENS10 TaxID=2769286 RepID=UPI001781A967|nr:flavin reductase family protein [Ensifer sp. ENS10]MBD9507968.1 flavin reductase [Ensifer sp. ENS10]